MILDVLKTSKFYYQNLFTAAVYIITGLFSNIWYVPELMVTPLWIPSGIALALVIWNGEIILPGIMIAETIVTVVLGNIHVWQNWAASIVTGFGAGLQVVLAARFIQNYINTKTPFYTVRDVLLFVGIADFLMSFTSSIIGTSALLFFDLIKLNLFLKNCFFWWVGDLVSIMVFTPLIMSWYHKKFIWNWGSLLEFIGLIVLLGCVISTIYKWSFPLAYLQLPFCVWAAVRFNTRMAIIVAFLIAIGIIWLEMHGFQEFNVNNVSTSFIFLQLFIAVMFFTTLILCAVMTERRKAQKELLETNIALESRVEQRTRDLNEKNIQLNSALNTLRQAETQLIQAEKMSSLGVLTAGIAHEINNPVNFISANIGPLKNDIEDIMQLLHKYAEITPDTPIKEKIEEITAFSEEIELPFMLQETNNLLNGIEEGARRTANIVKDLRTFSRLDESELKHVNIHENIDSTLTLLHSQFGDRIKLIKNYGDIPEIECFPGKINQVFMNIIVNAIHAIKEQGEITISTFKKDNNQITISVKDTGQGISKEARAKIFEPFFTTKPVGEGTGLGLSISYSIIQEHKGSITVNSKLGKGSEFLINLPINYVA